MDSNLEEEKEIESFEAEKEAVENAWNNEIGMKSEKDANESNKIFQEFNPSQEKIKNKNGFENNEAAYNYSESEMLEFENCLKYQNIFGRTIEEDNDNDIVLNENERETNFVNYGNSLSCSEEEEDELKFLEGATDTPITRYYFQDQCYPEKELELKNDGHGHEEKDQFVLELSSMISIIPEESEREKVTQTQDILAITPTKLTPSPPPDKSPVEQIKPMTQVQESPSIESFFKLSNSVLLQFVLLPGRRLYCKECRVDTKIGDLKSLISRIVQVPPKALELRKNKNLISDLKTLEDLGAKNRMVLTIEVTKKHRHEFTLKIPEEEKLEEEKVNFITVNIENEKGFYTLNVQIQYAIEKKRFLGGFYCKRTCVEYHNAATNTEFHKKPYKEKSPNHVASQTIQYCQKSLGVQTSKDQYQQCEKHNYYISQIHQKIIIPNKCYVSAEDAEQKRGNAAIVLQKFWRKSLAEKEKNDRLEGLLVRAEWADALRKGRTDARLEIKDDELRRQLNPTKLVDLEILYHAIENWKREQVDFIEETRWGAERKAALALITDMEIDLLLELEGVKTKIKAGLEATHLEETLNKITEPKRWIGPHQSIITMDTKEKQDAREYKAFFIELRAPCQDICVRKEILERLYNMIKDSKTSMADHLIKLIEREIILIDRNANKDLLIGLRQRISNGFYSLLCDHKFNPAAKILQKVPFDLMKLRKDMVQCKSCKKVQNREEFTIEKGTNVTSYCRTCTGHYRKSILRVDLNLYRKMLTEIRQDEQKAGVVSSIAYIINAYDLKFLIEKIWHGQSAISGIEDKYLLRLCRWRKNLPWSPWNSILLTEEEAVAHLHIKNIDQAYQQSFFDSIQVHHNAARIHFEQAFKLSLPLDPTLEKLCIQDTKKPEKSRKCTVVHH